MSLRESVIEQAAREMVEAFGGKFLKIKLAGDRGFPDRTILLPAKHTLSGRAEQAFVELKKPGKVPDPYQWDTLLELQAMGFDAFWTDNLLTIKAWLMGRVRADLL